MKKNTRLELNTDPIWRRDFQGLTRSEGLTPALLTREEGLPGPLERGPWKTILRKLPVGGPDKV